ncbi:MAG: hypothetical protein LBU80_02510, partial [Rikenellaceae bacterium]|nr:hypothetical protein [Rikenellaceae bacterium]
MKKRRPFWIVLLWVYALPGFAQMSFLDRHFSVEDGLSGNPVSVIFRDNRELSYFGARNGTNRFDCTLRVRSVNGEDGWSDNKKQLRVKGLFPFWETAAANCLYVLLLLLLIVVSIRMMCLIYKLKNSVKVGQRMMRVFTDISPDIRTSLIKVHTPL